MHDVDRLSPPRSFFLTVIAGGFGYYVRSFGYYSVVYGVLWGVIVLLLSAYLVAFFLLLGGELGFALWRDLADEDVTLTHLCSDANDARVV